jgi:hypothetical protein
MNDTETLTEVLASHFPNVVVEPNGAVRAKCEGADCDWFVLRDTPRTYRNWRVVIRLHSAHLARIVQARAGESCVCGRTRPVGGQCVCGCVASASRAGEGALRRWCHCEGDDLGHFHPVAPTAGEGALRERTETLAEVRLTDAEQEILRRAVVESVSPLTAVPAATRRILAARIVQARAGNPILADALIYYAERRPMNNPKGWDHVVRKVEQGIAANLWPNATTEQVEQARSVLATLTAARAGEGARVRNNGEIWSEHGHPDLPCSPPQAVRGVVACRAGEGAWVCGVCGEGGPAHNEHGARRECAFEPVWRPAGEGALRERIEAVLADGDHDAFCDQDEECECWRRRIRAALDTAGDPT